MSKYTDTDKLRNGIMQFVNEYGEIVGMFVTDFNILVERCGADVVKRVNRGRRPSDDLVKVVRCKDCKYLGVKDFAYGYCKKRMTGILSPTDYCSDGERGNE